MSLSKRLFENSKFEISKFENLKNIRTLKSFK